MEEGGGGGREGEEGGEGEGGGEGGRGHRSVILKTLVSPLHHFNHSFEKVIGLTGNLLVLSSNVTTPCLLTLVMLWMMFCGFTLRRSNTSSREAIPRIFWRLIQNTQVQSNVEDALATDC